jgi:hypothetical protein
MTHERPRIRGSWIKPTMTIFKTQDKMPSLASITLLSAIGNNVLKFTPAATAIADQA